MESGRNRSWPTALGFVLAFVAAAGGKACSFSEDDPPVAPPTLDVPLGADQVRAGLVTKDSELLGGDTARGRVGDYKLYNDRIAIIVAAAGASRGYHPYGGVILDADRMTSTGPAGNSAFGEVITSLDLSVLRADTVEVVADGRDDTAAIVRVTGGAAVMPLFDALLSQLFTPQIFDLEWTLDYVLEPGADALRLDYRVKNLSNETADFGLRISAFMFGDGVDPFVVGHGFDVPGGGATAPYYGAIGDDVSYIYGALDTSLNLLVTQSGVVATGHGEGFDLLAREAKTYSHYLVVGDGDLARTQALWRAVQKKSSKSVSGRVLDTAGAPVAGARVHAVLADPRNDTEDYVSRTISDAEGRFTMALEEGEYRILASTDALVSSEPASVTMDDDVADVTLTVIVPGRLEYDVRGEDGAALPAKVSVRRLGEAFPQLPARFGEPRGSRGLFALRFAHDGKGALPLPPGDYEVYVSRGNEYEVVTATLTISAGQGAPLDAMLVRSVDTRGWISTDTHVHAQLSPDSPDLYPYKVQAMVVEGLEMPVSTEHESIGDFAPAIRELGLERWMKGVVGSEITTLTYGHFNAYPMIPDPTKPGNGRVDWYGAAPAETFARIRDNPGEPFIQVNHPRSPSIGGYFSAMGFDEVAYTSARPDEWSLDFDGIEVLNGCGNGTVEQQPIRDWFSFLNHGERKVGAASTDNHVASTGDLGYPRTYVRMPTDAPEEAKVEDFASSFFGGRLSLSCGPFVTLQADGVEIGGTVSANGSVEVSVYVAAPSWMDVDVVEIIVDGVVVQTISVPEAKDSVRFEDDVSVEVPAGRDAWIAVSVRGDRRHGAWASNRPSFAVTNPLFVDGDGDGRWR